MNAETVLLDQLDELEKIVESTPDDESLPDEFFTKLNECRKLLEDYERKTEIEEILFDQTRDRR